MKVASAGSFDTVADFTVNRAEFQYANAGAAPAIAIPASIHPNTVQLIMS
jgi:hypothetical protein